MLPSSSDKEIDCLADVDLLQLDLSKVVQWARTWLLRLNPDKCESIVLSNMRTPPVPLYYLDTKLISSKPVVRYLGVFVDCHLNWNENWNDHCKYIAAKATRSLNFFVIVYSIVLLQLNQLPINVLCGLLWSMPVQFGLSIQLRIFAPWSVFSVELLVGLLVVDGIHPLIVGVSPQMIV